MNGLSVRGELLGRFMEIWNRYFIQFSQSGLAPFLDRYYAQWLHTNQRVRVLSEDGTYTNVTIRGIDSSGFLVAVDDNGNELKLLSDGNTFNFLEGLISKKIWSVCCRRDDCVSIVELEIAYVVVDKALRHLDNHGKGVQLLFSTELQHGTGIRKYKETTNRVHIESPV